MTALVLIAMTLSPSLPPSQPDAAHLARLLELLPARGRVLFVAAHPDDENTRLIAWLVQVKKLRVGYLSITRGDGGQNLIGKEQGPALGLLRTQELLAARRLDGAEQFFTRARDFGYSKSPEEALRFWGKERILEDLVQVYRTFRPDVIVTRFSPKPEETHGHHTASAQLALEGFTKAADPSFAPGQLKTRQIWKARRIVQNVGFFNNTPAPAEVAGLLREDVGAYDPLLGLSMGELAAESRTMHKSQGFGAARQVGPVNEWFELLAGEPMRTSFLDGVEETQPSPALAAFRPEAPELAIPALLEAWRQDPAPEIGEAIVASAGLHLRAVADQPVVAPGVALTISVGALLRRPAELSLVSVRLGALEVPGPGALTPFVQWEQKGSLRDLPPPLASDPAWLLQPPEEGYYVVETEADRIRPEPAPPLWADFTLRRGAQTFTVRRPIVYRWTDPVQGERTRAVELAPPATIDAAAPILLFPDGAARTVRVTVRASAGAVEGKALVEPPTGFTAAPAERPFKLGAAGSEVELQFELKPGPDAREGLLRLAVEIAGKRYDRGLRRIDYPHVPPQAWHPQARVRLVRFDLRRGGTRVGYIAGPGDEVAQVLAPLGYQITQLDEAALRERDLSAFDAIVVGVRAFNVHEWLPALKPRLFAYVEQGGVLVAQYNTKNRLSSLAEPLGPFPMTISQLRVTDETAAVTLGDDPVLRAPNQIGPGDFAGWVQERGLYFADSWDTRYAAPLSMHDPGEPPLKGSLLIARYGKGRFVYTGLSFFRQLPAGVPGAVRLFANLIAPDAR